MRSLRNVTEVWKFINRKRLKKRTPREADIRREVWKKHFMELLDGGERKGR